MDADGPLARLKKAIFNPILYENIADWIVVSARRTVPRMSELVHEVFLLPAENVVFVVLFQQNWWAVLLMGIALIMLMAGFIKICSVHTPSNNPKLPPPKKLTGTVRHVCCGDVDLGSS